MVRRYRKPAFQTMDPCMRGNGKLKRTSKFERHRAFHARQIVNCLKNGGRHRRIDRKQQNGNAARFLPAEMEGTDIDIGFTQCGSQTADETGRILIDDVEHMPFKIGFDLYAKQFDKPRRAIAENRT